MLCRCPAHRHEVRLQIRRNICSTQSSSGRAPGRNPQSDPDKAVSSCRLPRPAWATCHEKPVTIPASGHVLPQQIVQSNEKEGELLWQSHNSLKTFSVLTANLHVPAGQGSLLSSPWLPPFSSYWSSLLSGRSQLFMTICLRQVAWQCAN